MNRTIRKNVWVAFCALSCLTGALAAGTPDAKTYVLDGIGTAGERVIPGPCWWENGSFDGLNALQSQSLGSFNARAADDFILEAGRWHLTQTVKVCMAVSTNVATPVVELEIYDDCNGKPGTLRTTLTMPTATLLSTNVPFQGFNFYEFEFEWSTFQLGDADGCSRFWLSPFGRGTGGYFWATASNGTIQGAQGQFRSPSLGYADWTDGEDVVNFRRCSDFCFSVCAKSCYTIKDQGDFDLSGLSSIKFPNVEGFDASAADNFQIAPSHSSVEICRIEAYLATNCDPTRVFAEILSNSCNLPNAVLYTLRDPEVIEQVGVFYEGLQVYLFRFDMPAGVLLTGGNDYWLSLAALSGGTIFDRAVFLYRNLVPGCMDIHISGGVYKNSLAGIDVYTPVSDPDLEGAARDFAFRIYGTALPLNVDRPQLPGDANNDGVVNFQDITAALTHWGSQGE